MAATFQGDATLAYIPAQMNKITVHFYDTIRQDRWTESFDGHFDDGEFIDYYFSEGNYGCDCNRCLRSPDERNYPCSDNQIIKIEKIVANSNPSKVLYSEMGLKTDQPSTP